MLDDELDVFRYIKKGFVVIIEGGLLTFALVRYQSAEEENKHPPLQSFIAGEGKGSLPTSL